MKRMCWSAALHRLHDYQATQSSIQSRSRLACPWINGEACSPSPARRAVSPYAWPHAPDCRIVVACNHCKKHSHRYRATHCPCSRSAWARGSLPHQAGSPSITLCHQLRQLCSKLLTCVRLRGGYAGSTAHLQAPRAGRAISHSRSRRESFRSRTQAHSIRASARIASPHAASTQQAASMCAGSRGPRAPIGPFVSKHV